MYLIDEAVDRGRMFWFGRDIGDWLPVDLQCMWSGYLWKHFAFKVQQTDCASSNEERNMTGYV